MSGAMVEIGRLSIVLHGVSAAIAETAVGGLEAALRRRLDVMRIADSRAVPALHVDAFDLPPDADATTLRELLAERLVQAIGGDDTPPQEPEEGG
jgi:hypothetical protein